MRKMQKIAELLEYQNKEGELRNIRQNFMNSDAYKKYTQARKFVEKTPESLQALDKKAELYRSDYKVMQQKLQILSDEIEALNDSNLLGKAFTIEEQKYFEKNMKKNTEALKTLKQDFKKLEENMLATEQEYQNLRKKHTEMQAQGKEYKDKYATSSKEYQNSIADLEKELKALEKNLPKSEFSRYSSKRQEKLFPVICSVVDDRCECCSMQLSLNTLNKLAEGVECESCGRILYKK